MTAGALTGAVIGLGAACGLLLMLIAATSESGAPTRPARRLGRLVSATGVPGMTASRLVLSAVAAGIVAGTAALLVTAVPTVAGLTAALAACLPWLVLRRRAVQRRKALTAAWPEAVDALVSAVRAGLSLPEALGELGRRGPAALRPAFSQFEVEYHATGSFDQAAIVLQGRLADPVADRVVASLRIARDVGGSDLGPVLRTLSSLLREDARLRGEIQARQSWTVSAARLAVAAPWLTLALLCTRPEAVQAYRSTTGGVLLVSAALVSVAAYRLMLLIARLPAASRLAS